MTSTTESTGQLSGARADASPGNAREQARYIAAERVRLLYRNGPFVLAVSVAVALMLAGSLWQLIDRQWLLGWLALNLGIVAVRSLGPWAYQRFPELLADSRSWGILFAIGSGASGITWGLAATWFFVPEEPAAIVLLTGVLVAFVAAGAQGLSAYMPAFFAFSLPTILPLMVNLVLQGSYYLPLGVLGIFYLIAICAFALNSSRTLHESIRVRFENDELVRALSAEKAIAEENRRIAEQATIAKSKFLAAASHDLRQPLHAMGLFQNALESHVDESGKPILERMAQSTQALSGLFDGLLDVSRLDAGVVEANIGAVPLDGMLRALESEYRPAAASKGIGLSIDCGNDLVARTDSLMLERILRNLLDNALRYTADGRVTIRCEETGDDQPVVVPARRAAAVPPAVATRNV